MPNAFAVATLRGTNPHFEVCPNWDAVKGVCTCPLDANKQPTPPHATYDFGPSPDARMAAQWAQACANEVALLVKAASAPAVPIKVVALVGIAGTAIT